MSTHTKTEVGVRATASAALLYWLLLLCGLEGLTIVRVDTQHLGALWVGSIAGVALGQLVGWLRVRAWLLIGLVIGGLWLAPMLYSAFLSSFDPNFETLLCAFIPASICGYLALSERGALMAFWYPAVLWMLVILDGPGSFEPRTALPFGVGLAALFIAFVRARETRRTALWRSHAGLRVAKARPREVLRSSPFRTTTQLGWTLFVGAATLVLAAWIAPHLWQTKTTKAPPRLTSSMTAGTQGYSDGTCCSQEQLADANRVHFKEYFPLTSSSNDSTDAARRSALRVCEPCDHKRASVTASADLDRPYNAKYQPWNSPYDQGLPSAPLDSYPTPANTTPFVPTTPTYQPEVATIALTTTTTSSSSEARGSAPTFVAYREPMRTPVGAPWRAALLLSAIGVGIHLLLRAVKRSLTLRHLTRPFWTETLDQRISNHWERALIGLRDAGIHTTRDEQPHAFARRVDMVGLETCATILERVRHGVRVDATDLDSMNAAATTVYRAARRRAGVAACAVSWVRPLSA